LLRGEASGDGTRTNNRQGRFSGPVFRPHMTQLNPAPFRRRTIRKTPYHSNGLGGTRTLTLIRRRILKPLRLPIPPRGRAIGWDGIAGRAGVKSRTDAPNS